MSIDMTRQGRRRWLRRLGALGLAAGTAPAFAQDSWPSRSLRLVVPFVPGGVTDTGGRVVAEQLGKRLGQQVVVDNRPGASGNIGTGQVAQAPADGYTLLLAFDGTMVINPHVFASLPFDTARDFAAVGKIGDAALVLAAHPAVPVRTLDEVIALSKTTPGGLSYGTSGTGGTPHVGAELLKQRTGANLTHIPYKGGAQAVADTLGGNIPLVYSSVAGAQGFIKSGKLRAIAVSSAHRLASLPDVPTFIESGAPDFIVNSWIGLMVPFRTPAAIVARLNAELNAVLADPDVKARLAVSGIDATPGTPEVFRDEVRRDLARYGQVVKASGIKLD